MRILFAPVSGPRGTGELARAAALASRLSSQCPAAQVRMLVSRQYAGAALLPFEKTLLSRSPTLCTPEVAAAIHDFQPSVVVFDNAGRTAQLKLARTVGARTVFVSSRPSQRRRAFRLRWMRLLDEHWIAWPRLIAGALRPLERYKQSFFPGLQVRFMDVVMPLPDPVLARHLFGTHGLEPGNYVLVVPGGGTVHPGMPHVAGAMQDCARELASLGYCTVVIGTGGQVPAVQSLKSPLLLPRLSIEETLELIRGARTVICNGGDTLLQTLALERPCVAVPMAPDQHLRLRRLRAAGVDIETRPDGACLASSAVRLLEDVAARDSLIRRIGALGLSNAMPLAMQVIQGLQERTGA